MRISAICSAVLATLGFALLHVEAQAQTVELKFASSAPPTSPWAKQIDRTAAFIDAETKSINKVRLENAFYDSSHPPSLEKY